MCAKEDSTKNQIEQPKKEERFSPNPTKAHQKTSKQVCRSKLAPTGQLLQLPNRKNKQTSLQEQTCPDRATVTTSQ